MVKLIALFASLPFLIGPAQNHGDIELSLRVVGGHLLVPVQASDGSELQLILSTGSLGTSLAESTAERLGDSPTLTFGGIPIDLGNSNTMPDAELTVGGTRFDGILDAHLLTDYDVLIDAPGGRLVLRPLGRPTPWEGVTLADPVPMRIFHGVIIALNAELNGRPYFAMFDLGMNTMVANAAAAEQLELAAEDVATVGVGALSVADVDVKTLDLPMFERWDPDNQGFFVIGAPIAHDCAIAISWARGELRTCAR